MYERIVVPLDGSKRAEEILPHIRRFLVLQDPELILVSAAPFVRSDEKEAPPPSSSPEEYLDKIMSGLREEGARVRRVVRTGPIAATILNVAVDENASLIAMCTHGRTGLKRFSLGSVTEKVIQASSVPLFVHRSFPETDAKRDRTIRTILVPIDGSENSLAILKHAVAFARIYGAELLLVHVFEGEEMFMEAPEIKAIFAPVRELLANESIPFGTVFRRGEAASEILDVCVDQSLDMIAMTTHGRSGISRWVFGSVTEKVLRQSSVPMLVVRNSGK